MIRYEPIAWKPAEVDEKQRLRRLHHSDAAKARWRAWRGTNPENIRNGIMPPEYYQARSRLVKYNVTPEQYEQMLADQEGVCAICKQPETGRGSGGNPLPLSIDHNHTTGKVRGLLCNKCNRQLGWYEQQMFGIHAYIAGVE